MESALGSESSEHAKTAWHHRRRSMEGCGHGGEEEMYLSDMPRVSGTVGGKDLSTAQKKEEEQSIEVEGTDGDGAIRGPGSCAS